MTAMLARALRAVADRIAPSKPIVINRVIHLDGKEIARAVADAHRRSNGGR